jgi:hypothetical protein
VIPLRIVALVVLALALVVFAIRNAPERLLESERATQVREEPERMSKEERDLLSHQTDSILARDLETLARVAVGFPRARPVVAFLYQASCQACRRAKPTWEHLAAELLDRADVLAATIDPGLSVGPFLDAPNVRHLTFETRRDFERAFRVSYVVPITLVIAPSGRVRWASLGPLDDASATLAVAAVGDVRP